jgi:E3 ubiquitin-protein ligase TRIP12
MPPWCQELTKACPFLFPFETRRQYFYSTALGLSRALQYFQQQQSAENPNLVNNRGRNVVRLERQKVRVSRRRILDSAVKVMEMFCSGQKAVLEVEYFGEVGTGLGPTLEFYTLVSQELQRSTLGMWRTCSSPKEAVERDVLMADAEEDNLSQSAAKDDGHHGYTDQSLRFVQAPLGLFPRPFRSNMDSSNESGFSKVRDNFCLLGRLMAKALQDGRLVDLPLSTAFYKLVLGQELDLHDIRSFDLQLGSTLQEMEALVHRKQFLESIPGDNKEAISNLSYRGARIEDLCIDFTLPGFPDYPLKPGGNNILVNIDNMEEYVSLVVDATIKTGVMSQIEAFRTGFNQVLPLSSLQIFTENELDYLFCGVRNLWVAETLTDYIKFDHGYTSQSPPILNLLEIMVEFTPSQQQAFLQFITGCPRLPPGGLGALNPKLTVVRKNFSGAIGDPNSQKTMDAELPSVMTCANYLKLPPYSSKEVMHDRLLYAITEGQGSFDLS